MSLHLKKFDMRRIADDSTVVMLGKRNTGKSVLVRDLLFYKKHMPVGTVISATESANKFYQDHVPPTLIHEEFSPDLIRGFLARQKKIVGKMGEDETRTGKGRSKIDPKAFLILDDCLFDNTWSRTKEMRYVFMNGRHLKILSIITMQYPLGVPPTLRTNIDYVFILRENVLSNRKRIFEQYAGMFPSFDMFCQIMDQCTENYECLVIHNGAKSNKIEDQVFWYKADLHPPFKLCTPEVWRQAAAAGNKIHSAGWLGDDQSSNIRESRPKGSGGRVTVNRGVTNF
jgi:hypothetical protein